MSYDDFEAVEHHVDEPCLTIGGWIPQQFELHIHYGGKDTALYIPYEDCHLVLEMLNEYLQSKGIKSYIERKFDNNKKGGEDE